MRTSSTIIGGHTLIEMMIAMLVAATAIAGAMAGWGFIARTERVNSVQAQLDMSVRKSMEKLKRDLRLTAMNKMFFYPSGPGPYTAVSFPMATPGTNGLIPMDAGGSNILWDQTVIYHVKTTTPYRLLRTVILQTPNTMTDPALAAQLTSVVAQGNGGTTNATTETVFENLFTWSIHGQGAVFDGYSPTFSWNPGVSFGSFLMTNGTHQLKFTVSGKNTASSGYRVGVDTVVCTPCGVEREAEAQLPVASQAGAVAQVDYMAEGAWSGNYQLLFPATATGQTFTLTMDNDRWEETNFRGEGALCSKTVVEFDQTVNPYDFSVRLEGDIINNNNSWQADWQTGASNAVNDSATSLANTVVRVLVRGRNLLPNGGATKFSGKTFYANFMASVNGPLKIKGAFIAEAANQASPSPDGATDGTQLYFSQWGSGYTKDDVNIPAGGNLWCRPTSDFGIDSTKSYVISFAVGDNGGGICWPETHSGVPGAYVIAGSSDPTIAASMDWSSRSPAVSSSLYGLYGIFTLYPTNGLFTSQVLDTQLPAPVFGSITWNADKPSGTSLKIKVRAGDDPQMTNAPAWSTVTGMTMAGAITAASKRYVQFQAVLDPDTGGWNTPKLKDVTLRWTGGSKMVDVGAIMTKGPNYGICELTIDGKPLTKALSIDLTIFDDVNGGWESGPKRLTSSMTAEIDPRNTGM